MVGYLEEAVIKNSNICRLTTHLVATCQETQLLVSGVSSRLTGGQHFGGGLGDNHETRGALTTLEAEVL